MNNSRFVYVRNAEDDAYLNSADNFKGVTQTGSGAITILFDAAEGAAGNNAGFDKIILAVTANKEKEAMLAVAGAIAGGKAGSTVVVADDHGNVTCAEEILTVTSITKNTAGNALTLVESVTPAGDGTGASDNGNTRQLAASDSGKTFFVNMATNTAAFRLPAVAGNAGVNYRFIMDFASDAEGAKDFIISTNANGENIMGAGVDGGVIHDNESTCSVITLDSSAGAVGAGDRLACVTDGTHWYITECTALTADAWVTADNAI